jgi:hypothetical protein
MNNKNIYLEAPPVNKKLKPSGLDVSAVSAIRLRSL